MLCLKLTNLGIATRFIRFSSTKPKSKYDAIIIGGGHNGLVSAAYLQKSGFKVCVLEKRHVIGGAAVTEEIFPGFKISRASYVLSLLRPVIIKELELEKHGLKVFSRNLNSFTPLSEWENKNLKSLSLYLDRDEKLKEIARFSTKDAQAYVEYDQLVSKVVSSLNSILDERPPDFPALFGNSLGKKIKAISTLKPLFQMGKSIGNDFPFLIELLFSSAAKILNKWFECNPLKSTLATDGVIGAMHSPYSAGSAYLLLHHVMGNVNGAEGAWGYVQGGMGSVSNAIAKSAQSFGAEIFTDTKVKKIKLRDTRVDGVVLENGVEITSPVVLSNATPKVTFLELIDQNILPENFRRHVANIDYTSSVTKINMALKGLPNFLAAPHSRSAMNHHRGSIHINCEHMDMIEKAFLDGRSGKLPERPMIEMVIPSTLDQTLAPEGSHVAQIFSQFTPYNLSDGKVWNEQTKKEYFDIVVNSIERYAPSFRNLIIDYEILSPPDLETIFGLTNGNIFHGALSLDQLYFNRPTPFYRPPQTPIEGLILCGSGSHPGGGVSGAPGRLAALTVIDNCRNKKC